MSLDHAPDLAVPVRHGALVLDGLRKDGKWAYGSVERGDVSTFDGWIKAMTNVGIILDHAPDLAKAVRDPITLTPDGLILDGRNRYAACQRVGVEPRFVVTDDDPGTVVRSRNGTRRHMTTGQLVASMTRSLMLDGKRVSGRCGICQGG